MVIASTLYSSILVEITATGVQIIKVEHPFRRYKTASCCLGCRKELSSLSISSLREKHSKQTGVPTEKYGARAWRSTFKG